MLTSVWGPPLYVLHCISFNYPQADQSRQKNYRRFIMCLKMYYLVNIAENPKKI